MIRLNDVVTRTKDDRPHCFCFSGGEVEVSDPQSTVRAGVVQGDRRGVADVVNVCHILVTEKLARAIQDEGRRATQHRGAFAQIHQPLVDDDRPGEARVRTKEILVACSRLDQGAIT